jgi:hypothetical protein
VPNQTARVVKLIRHLALLLVLCPLAGCQYGHRVESTEFAFDPERGNGVIVGSVTETTGGSRPDNVYFGFARSDGTNRGLLATNATTMAGDVLVGFMFSHSDFAREAGVRGRVFAVELPPGDYALLGWLIESGRITLTPIQAPPLRFSVRRGEVTYVGNLNMVLTDTNGSLWSSVSSGEARIDDRAERDLPILVTRYATLRNHTIAKQLVDGTPWRGLSTNRTVRSSPTVIVLPR